jgi:hypothetical protein
MTAAPGLQPIETHYRGHRFRSRLEARYAVFMDAMGVEWQYEPEGFALKAGHYLPDFYLPQVNNGVWLEIKPHGLGSHFGFTAGRFGKGNDLRDPRLFEFAEAVESTGKQFFVAYGIPSEVFFKSPDYEDEGMLEAPGDPFMWCVCGCTKTVGIQFDGRGDRIRCPHAGCLPSSHGDKGYSFDHALIVAAADIARKARFEHGETPKVAPAPRGFPRQQLPETDESRSVLWAKILDAYGEARPTSKAMFMAQSVLDHVSDAYGCTSFLIKANQEWVKWMRDQSPYLESVASGIVGKCRFTFWSGPR